MHDVAIFITLRIFTNNNKRSISSLSLTQINVHCYDDSLVLIQSQETRAMSYEIFTARCLTELCSSLEVQAIYIICQCLAVCC